LFDGVLSNKYINKCKWIKYWIDSPNEDFETIMVMFETKKIELVVL